MHETAAILLSLFVIFVAAQIGAEIAQRVKLPGVVGEIAAGCVIGPSALGWITAEQIVPGTPLEVLAEIGVVLLLFSVGIETRLADLKKVGRSAFLVGASCISSAARFTSRTTTRAAHSRTIPGWRARCASRSVTPASRSASKRAWIAE